MDSHGLAIELDIPATPAGVGLRAMVSSGCDAMSIGLVDIKATYSRDEAGMLCRAVIRADINHVTICDAGAYAGACCWLSDMPVAHMPPKIANASRRWQLGVIARDRKRAEDRETVARYQAKLAAERKAVSNARVKPQYKPEPLQMPPAWFGAMQAAWF